MQVAPIKPKLKPPETNRLKLKCDILLRTSAFKFNLRRYTMASEQSQTLFEAAFVQNEVDQAALVQAGRCRLTG